MSDEQTGNVTTEAQRTQSGEVRACPFCAISAWYRNVRDESEPTVEVMLTETKTVWTCEVHGRSIRKPAKTPPAERQHLVPSAAFWFKAARVHSAEGRHASAMLALEQAYNHVENALAAVTVERDKAVAFASKVERGEVSFAKKCDAQLALIAALPLGKGLEENLAQAVARVLEERNTRAGVNDDFDGLLKMAVEAGRARERRTKGEYVRWDGAGGPDECLHGRAAGIACPLCDRATVSAFFVYVDCLRETGLARVASPQGDRGDDHQTPGGVA